MLSLEYSEDCSLETKDRNRNALPYIHEVRPYFSFNVLYIVVSGGTPLLSSRDVNLEYIHVIFFINNNIHPKNVFCILAADYTALLADPDLL